MWGSRDPYNQSAVDLNSQVMEVMEVFCRCLKREKHTGTGTEKVLAFVFETNSNLRSWKGKKGWYTEKNSTEE